MATCVVFAIFLRFKFFTSLINQSQWNVLSITAADYSVELPIEKEALKRWIDEVYNSPTGENANKVSLLLSLKKHIIKVLETSLTDLYREQ